MYRYKHILKRILGWDTPRPPAPLPFQEKYQPAVHASLETIFLPAASISALEGQLNRVRLRIGRDSMIGARFVFESLEGEIDIGERTLINAGTTLISRSHITIGNDVTIAWGCTIYDHDSHSLHWQHRQADVQQQNADHRAGRDFRTNKDWTHVKTAPIVVEDKVWLGFDVVVLKGVTIGEGAIVGARSVVSSNVPPFTVVAGNPARVIKPAPRDVDPTS